MNLRELEKLIKTNHHPHSFYYKKNYYIMEEYDMEGIYLNYSSKKAKKDITIHTPNNRYSKNLKEGYRDMYITITDKTSYRYDINYDEPTNK